MTTKHKWHKEIKAWADGEEIEVRFINRKKWTDDWTSVSFDSITGYDWNDTEWEFRIKPQPKELQNLYAYYGFFINGFNFFVSDKDPTQMNEHKYIGKIKIEEEN